MEHGVPVCAERCCVRVRDPELSPFKVAVPTVYAVRPMFEVLDDHNHHCSICLDARMVNALVVVE